MDRQSRTDGGRREKLNFIATHTDDTANRIYVYFCMERNVSKAAIKTYVWMVQSKARG